MQVWVNGEAREVPAEATVETLVAALALGGQKVAVERNRQVVARKLWAATLLREGDRLEVVTFVGGG